MLREDLNALLREAQRGNDPETRKLILFAINDLKKGEQLAEIISALEPFYGKWSKSKQYFFSRLKIRQGQVLQGERYLQQLSKNGYPPALCKLGTRVLYQKSKIGNQEIGLELLQQSAVAGHPIAKRNLSVWRARNSSKLSSPFFYFVAMYWLAIWLMRRPRNPY